MVSGRNLTLKEAVKDELCSRWLAEILLKNAEGFAKENPDAANLLRKAMRAADGHLYDGFYKATDAEEYHSIVDSIAENEDFHLNETYIKISDSTPAELFGEKVDLDYPLLIMWKKLYAIIRKDGALILKKNRLVNYHSMGKNSRKISIII